MLKPVSLALLASTLVSHVTLASTGFSIAHDTPTGRVRHYAISTGWYTPARAAATLNPRKLHRVGTLEPGGVTSPEWTSRYWSLTQTMYGAGFPMSGVNEKGLVIQSTVLRDLPYPPVPPGAMALQRAQWMQYHLDTSASLAEVLAKAFTSEHPVIPQGTVNAQFQVCDAADCAVIAYYDGKAVAYGSIGRIEMDLTTRAQTVDRAKRWPWATIANHTMDASVAAVDRCSVKPCTDLNDSLERFTKVTNTVRAYAGATPELRRVFADLKSVDQGYPKTTWNEVYTVEQRGDAISVKLSYKAPGRPFEDVQSISVASSTPDLDCKGAIRLWWLDLDQSGGDRTSAWVKLDRAAQEALAYQHDKDKGGMFPRSTLAPMAAAPEKNTRCDAPGG